MSCVPARGAATGHDRAEQCADARLARRVDADQQDGNGVVAGADQAAAVYPGSRGGDAGLRIDRAKHPGQVDAGVATDRRPGVPRRQVVAGMDLDLAGKRARAVLHQFGGHAVGQRHHDHGRGEAERQGAGGEHGALAVAPEIPDGDAPPESARASAHRRFRLCSEKKLGCSPTSNRRSRYFSTVCSSGLSAGVTTSEAGTFRPPKLLIVREGDGADQLAGVVDSSARPVGIRSAWRTCIVIFPQTTAAPGFGREGELPDPGAAAIPVECQGDVVVLHQPALLHQVVVGEVRTHPGARP